VTYAELAAVRGIDRHSAVKLSFRRHWRSQKDNYGTVTRQLEELRRATVPADVIQAAQARRWGRLQAALGAMPALHTAPVAEAVGRPPEAVSRALAEFAARVVRDLGEMAGE
jgi:hypothetical protein